LNENKIVDDIPLNIGVIHSIRLDEHSDIAVVVGVAPSVKVYRLPRFELIQELQGHTGPVNQCEIDYVKEIVYTISDDGTLRSWDLAEIEETPETEVLIKHVGPGRCLALSNNEKYLFGGGDDCLIRVFDLMIKEEVLNLKSHSAAVVSLTVNTESNLLASGGADFLVIVWNILDFTPMNVFSEHSGIVNTLRFAVDQNFLVSGSDDFSMRVWDLDKDRREIVLNSHSAPVQDLLITGDNALIVSCSDDKSLKIWTFPEFMEEINFKVLSNDFNSIIETREAIISCGSDHKVRFWFREKDEAGVIHSTNGVGLKVCASLDEEWLAVSDDYGFLYLIANKAPFPVIKEFQAHKGSIRDMCFIKSGELVTGGGDSKILIWNIETWDSKQLRGHQQSIWCIGYTPFIDLDADFLVSGSSDKTIRIWDLIKLNEICKFQVPEQATALSVTHDGRYVISGGINGTLTVWNISERVEESIFTLHTDTITGLFITEDSSKIMSVSKDASIQFISLEYRIPLSFLTRKQPILCLAITEDQEAIITGEHQMIYMQDNPLISQKTRILGPEDNVQKFLTYMKTITSGQIIPHDPAMDKFIIVPYFFNSLHIYTFLGLREHLTASLVETAVMIPSKEGYHPLYIALLKGLKGIRDDVVDSLIALGGNNPFLFQILENVMILMNKKAFPKLGDLYEAIYQPAFRRSLPKFCSPDIPLPIVVISEHPRVRPEDFFDAEEMGSQGQGILFKESYVKISYQMGSKDSIEFLESLANCTNLNVMRSPLIQAMVQYKWQHASYPMMIQGICFYCYLLVLSLFTAFLNFMLTEMRTISTVGLFFLNSLLLLYELFQMSVSGSFYFTYIWNYIDWCRGILLYLYIIIAWTGRFEEGAMSVLSLVIFLSFLRGISYFRLFKMTRYLINLLFQVVADIGGFLILLSYSTLSFCFLFIVLVKCSGTPEEVLECEASKTFSLQLLSSYNLVLGNLEAQPTDLVEFFCVTFALLINPIIMLNLLISIIGDTYDRVQSDSLSADMKELMDMIQEVENMMFFRRGQNGKQFFQECTEFEKTDLEGGWEGKLRALQGMIEKIEAKNTEHHNLLLKKVRMQDKVLSLQAEKIDLIAKSMIEKKRAMTRVQEMKDKR
jgi:WD40 repeat protein